MKIEILDTDILFDDFLKLERITLKHELFDGTMSSTMERLVIPKNDAIGVLLYDPDEDTLILVDQFRLPAHYKGHDIVTEIVAGIVEDGENVEDALQREVLEESGYSINNWDFIMEFYSSPGFCSERILLYYAEVSREDKSENGGGVEEENEHLLVREFAPEDLFEQVKSNKIVDAKTIIALQWFELKYRK